MRLAFRVATTSPLSAEFALDADFPQSPPLAVVFVAPPSPRDPDICKAGSPQREAPATSSDVERCMRDSAEKMLKGQVALEVGWALRGDVEGASAAWAS